MKIYIARTESQINAAFPVMLQLRPHLSKSKYNAQIMRQQKQGYNLAVLEDSGNIVAVAGIRRIENFAHGKLLYVDDLVTDGKNRSKGYGNKLFDWIVKYAKRQNCDELHLDSGVQRFDAHRFYLRKRMSITAHHFGRPLK